LHLYQNYPDDFLIQFELAKDSVINSKPDVYKKIIEKMNKKKEEEKDENIKGIYNNYILYADALSKIANNQYTEAKNKLEEILEIRKEENNVILNYNIGILDIYKTNLKEGYDKLNDIYQDKNNDNKNDYIKDTIKNIKDIFNIK
jgi:predicted Zn-dependent protease